jgi:hypothetical protein
MIDLRGDGGCRGGEGVEKGDYIYYIYGHPVGGGGGGGRARNGGKYQASWAAGEGGGGSAGQLILQKWIPVTHFAVYVALAH